MKNFGNILKKTVERRRVIQRSLETNTQNWCLSEGPLEKQNVEQHGIAWFEKAQIDEGSSPAKSSFPDGGDQSELVEQDPSIEEEWDVIEDFLLNMSGLNDLNFETLFEDAGKALEAFCENGNVQKYKL